MALWHVDSMWTVKTQPSDDLIVRYGWAATVIAQALLTTLRNARTRARSKQIEFSLSYEYLEWLYLKQQGRCYYSDRLMESERDSDRKTSRSSLILSIDRLDPDGGYIPGNVCLCCCDVNIAKSDMTAENFIKMCNSVTEAQSLHSRAREGKSGVKLSKL